MRTLFKVLGLGILLGVAYKAYKVHNGDCDNCEVKCKCPFSIHIDCDNDCECDEKTENEEKTDCGCNTDCACN